MTPHPAANQKPEPPCNLALKECRKSKRSENVTLFTIFCGHRLLKTGTQLKNSY